VVATPKQKPDAHPIVQVMGVYEGDGLRVSYRLEGVEVARGAARETDEREQGGPSSVSGTVDPAPAPRYAQKG
jgi:hypothetical protein